MARKYYCLLLLLLIPFDSLGAHPKQQSITYHYSSTVLWGLGAEICADTSLAYYFFPFTYTREIGRDVTYSQFIMYRYENYRPRPGNSWNRIWHQFHEIYILPGVRFKRNADSHHGAYFACHAGLGGGIGNNFSLRTVNIMPEVGYVAKPFHKQLFASFNFSLLFCGPIYQNPPVYQWDNFTLIGIMAHLLIPLFGLNIGLVF